MRIDSSLVTMLNADMNRDSKVTMPKLNVSDDSFKINSKISQTEINRGVSLELNTDNLEEIKTIKETSFTPVNSISTEPIEVNTLYLGDISKYLGLLNSEVSLADIKEKGIDGFPEYRSSGNVYNDKSSIEDFFEKGADKYSEILSQLEEKYDVSSKEYKQQKGDLDIALTRYFEKKVRGTQKNAYFYSNSLDEYNNSAFKSNAGNTAKYFIEKFDKNDDVKAQINKALDSAFPDESTSSYNMSLKDYEIIRKETEANFNKGTGLDLMENLSKNYDLSEVIRKSYENLLKQHQKGSDSLYYNYQV